VLLDALDGIYGGEGLRGRYALQDCHREHRTMGLAQCGMHQLSSSLIFPPADNAPEAWTPAVEGGPKGLPYHTGLTSMLLARHSFTVLGHA
jgi:hypothetical protein